MSRKPGPRPKLLNVRQHLELVQLSIEIFQEYGDCPIFRDALARVSLINRAIMRKHDEARAKGNRKDIPV